MRTIIKYDLETIKQVGLLLDEIEIKGVKNATLLSKAYELLNNNAIAKEQEENKEETK